MRARSKATMLVLIIPSLAFAQTVNVTTSSPPEAKLAAIDSHSNVVPQSTVRRYARVLDDLDRKCKENRQQIGDIEAKSVQLFAEKKVPMTHLKVLDRAGKEERRACAT